MDGFVIAAVLLPIIAGIYHGVNIYAFHHAIRRQAILEGLAVTIAMAAIMSVLMVIVTAWRYMG